MHYANIYYEILSSVCVTAHVMNSTQGDANITIIWMVKSLWTRRDTQGEIT